MSLEQDILNAIDTLFSHCHIQEQDKSFLIAIKDESKKLEATSKDVLVNHLLNSTLPVDNALPMYFFLYDCFKDVRFLEKALDYVPKKLSLQLFYEVYLNFSNRLFSSSDGSSMVQDALRKWFTATSADLKKFLSTRGLSRNAYPFDAPRNIAILSPQLLNMRHSPTREAYSLALHLESYHNCNCYIINTNAMSFAGLNSLELIQPVDFFNNEQLNGMQKLRIQYMDFDADVNIVSFPTGPMTTQKVANIIDALHQLNIEAVISHGDNLVIMESLYQDFPSLFATTGAVVPFNHCDAYFIPGDLFTESAKQQAAEFGHSNFMMESMLVTPEGISESPALRSNFHLTESDFVYLVVGTRLHNEINQGFATICNKLLEADIGNKILFAGTPELELEKYFSAEAIGSKKVQNIGFQNDLPAISTMCDCYLNPQRAGGGTSSQTAIINGLPIVTLAEGHISAVVPEDKRQANWDDYLEYANQLRENRSFLESERDMYKEHFYTNLDARAQVRRMYEMLCKVASD